jgi:hypothetical protein
MHRSIVTAFTTMLVSLITLVAALPGMENPPNPSSWEGPAIITISDPHHHPHTDPRRDLEEEEADDCPVCGDLKMITLPDSTVQVPAEDGTTTMDLTCSELQELGNVGNISSVLCPLVQPLVQDACGCEDIATVAPSSKGGEDGSSASSTNGAPSDTSSAAAASSSSWLSAGIVTVLLVTVHHPLRMN